MDLEMEIFDSPEGERGIKALVVSICPCTCILCCVCKALRILYHQTWRGGTVDWEYGAVGIWCSGHMYGAVGICMVQWAFGAVGIWNSGHMYGALRWCSGLAEEFRLLHFSFKQAKQALPLRRS